MVQEDTMANAFIKVELGNKMSRAYTYAWEGEGDIARDDYVVVPPNSYNENPSVGRVLSVVKTPGFDGKITILTQKVDPGIRQMYVKADDRYAVEIDGMDLL